MISNSLLFDMSDLFFKLPVFFIMHFYLLLHYTHPFAVDPSLEFKLQILVSSLGELSYSDLHSDESVEF